MGSTGTLAWWRARPRLRGPQPVNPHLRRHPAQRRPPPSLRAPILIASTTRAGCHDLRFLIARRPRQPADQADPGA